MTQRPGQVFYYCTESLDDPAFSLITSIEAYISMSSIQGPLSFGSSFASPDAPVLTN